MLAVHCTQCGAPTPVSLATPDRFECVHCGFQGRNPPQVAANLQSAAHALFATAERDRQLSSYRRVQVTRTNIGAALYVLLLLILIVPFVVGGGACVAITGSPEPWQVLVLLAPLVVMTLCGAVGLWWIRRAARGMQDAHAAIAPMTPGQAARCHVCGAPLPGEARGAVARCAFCRADNVVSSDVIERTRARNSAVFDGFEREVKRSAASAGSRTALASAGILVVSYGLPFVTVVGAFLVFVVLFNQQREADPSIEYVAWPSPQGECLGRLERNGDGSGTVDFSDDPPVGLQSSIRIKSLEAVRIVRAKDVVGKFVLRGDGVGGKVVRVFSTLAFHDANRAQIRAYGGGELDNDIVGRCFAKSDYPREGPKLPARATNRRALMMNDGSALLIGVGGQVIRHEGEETETLWMSQGLTVHGLAMDESHYYVCDRNTLFRRSRGGGANQTLAAVQCRGRGMALFGTSVYIATSASLVSVPKNGGEPEVVNGLGEEPVDVVSLSGALHVLDAKTGQVFRRTQEGATTVVSGAHPAMAESDLVVSGDTLYWISRKSELIAVAAGGSTTKVATTCDKASGPFVVVGDEVFWAKLLGERSISQDMDSIWVRRISGGGARAYTGRIDPVLGMHATGNHLYWLEEYKEVVMVGVLEGDV